MENSTEQQKISLYSEGKNYKLYNGNMLEMLDVIEPNSIDAIVTDPPYELGFMSKSWDSSGIAFQKETWEKCLKVLKPGGYLLAFGGSRTSHRIACAIEDAGFEIRDTIMWLYGCLSEDTEVLTQQGFKQFHKITNDDKIRVYDIKARIYKWETPQRWSVYKTEQDTCYRIKSDSTDQLVSRNHRCLVEREGKLVFEFAENLRSMERVPVLSYDIPYLQEGRRDILFTDLLWQDERLAKELFSKWVRKEKSEEGSCRGNKFCMERWSNLSESKRELFQSANKICSVSERVYIDGEKRWICDGTSITGGSTDRETFVENRGSTPQESQCGGQQIGESDVICNEQRSQDVRGWKTYTTTLATVTPEQYSGIIFCPTVSTGCFVARRNGKVFITGNSGFPKSMDISKSLDKHFGFQGEKIGERKFGKTSTGQSAGWHNNNVAKTGKQDIFAPATDLAKRWQGFGTALKPAYEPIIVARKPCEGSCIDNVMKYGVGGINIDECRVPTDDTWSRKEQETNAAEGYQRKNKSMYCQKSDGEMHENGRFPANVILTYDETDFEEVCGGMPTSGRHGSVKNQPNVTGESGIYNSYGDHPDFTAYTDEGSAARYFMRCNYNNRDEVNLEFDQKRYIYSPKASKRDRNEGLPNGQHNIHPTLKPVSLMQYLVRLVTPKCGTILDPFNGSGSTGKAAMYENNDRNADYKYIGIELSAEYLAISDARIRYASGATETPDDAAISNKPQGIVTKNTKSTLSQFSLFDLPE